MRLTADGDYAVRVIVELAARPSGVVLRTEELGRATGVPRPYLAKITQMLARAGLVQTRRGATGGVTLARDPATVTLRHMVEAAEGPIVLNRCLVRAGTCPRDVFCGVHPVWARIQAVLLRELDAVTARDLVALTAARSAAGARNGAGGLDTAAHGAHGPRRRDRARGSKNR
jgi:Rrf2 family protein